jgi:ABC-type polysaccharide transport system permease subunit
VTRIPSDLLLTVILLALAIYFSVLVARALSAYLQFRRLAPTALVSWTPPRPRYLSWLVALGVVSFAVAVLNGTLNRPFHHVYSQGVMAAYFIVMVPLVARIRPGLYRDGIWADRGFLSWERIGRMAFVETPEIVLVMVPRGGASPMRLAVPPGEYGTVRKLLEEKIRARQLMMEKAILGL